MTEPSFFSKVSALAGATARRQTNTLADTMILLIPIRIDAWPIALHPAQSTMPANPA
jgi:hypothetical protein